MVTHEFLSQNEKQIVQSIGPLWRDEKSLLKPIFRFVTPHLAKNKRFDCIFYIMEIGKEVSWKNIRQHRMGDSTNKLTV